MTFGQLAGGIALLALAVLLIVLAVVAWRLYKSVQPTLDNVADLTKELQTTIDEVNQELAKVNEATAAVQNVATRVDNIATLVQETVSSPLIKVAGYGAGVSSAVKTFLGRRQGNGK